MKFLLHRRDLSGLFMLWPLGFSCHHVVDSWVAGVSCIDISFPDYSHSLVNVGLDIQRQFMLGSPQLFNFPRAQHYCFSCFVFGVLPYVHFPFGPLLGIGYDFFDRFNLMPFSNTFISAWILSGFSLR